MSEPVSASVSVPVSVSVGIPVSASLSVSVSVFIPVSITVSVPVSVCLSVCKSAFWSASLPFSLQVCLSEGQPCLQEYVAAVAQDQTAAAEKAAMLMSATGGSPAGVGSEYVIDPPSTLAAEDSDDNSDGENDDVAPLDRQVCSNWSINSHNLHAFQLIVFAGYALGVPKPESCEPTCTNMGY